MRSLLHHQVKRLYNIIIVEWHLPNFKNGMILGQISPIVFDCMSGKAIEVFWGNDRKVHEFHGRFIGDHALLSNKNNSHTPNTYSQVAPLDNGVNSETSFLIKNVNPCSLVNNNTKSLFQYNCTTRSQSELSILTNFFLIYTAN